MSKYINAPFCKQVKQKKKMEMEFLLLEIQTGIREQSAPSLCLTLILYY